MKKIFMDINKSSQGYKYSEECFKDCLDKRFYINKVSDYDGLSHLENIIGYVDNVSVDDNKLVGDCTIIDTIFKDMIEHLTIVPCIFVLEKENNEIKKCELLGFSIDF